MTDKRFVYNEDLLASCASSNAVRLFLLQRASPNDENGIPNACWGLLEQHAQHYGRPLTDQNANSRIRRFLESVLLVHDHNQRSLLHKAGLNQFADSDGPFAPPSEEEWLQLWKNEDWETQTMGEVSLIRLHDNESIRNASFHLHAHARSLRTTKHRSMKTIVSPYDAFYPSFKIAQDNDFRETNIDTSTKHSHKDSDDDAFQTHLNWATGQNPDGVPIVHPVHDQVQTYMNLMKCCCVCVYMCMYRHGELTSNSYLLVRVLADRVGHMLPLAPWRQVPVVVRPFKPTWKLFKIL